MLVSSGGNAALSDKWKKEYLPEHCVTSVEIFDPVTETWSVGPSLANALCGAGKSLFYVHVFGYAAHVLLLFM